MDTKSKKISLHGDEYEIKQLTAQDMMDMWAVEGKTVDQMTLMSSAITKNGETIENFAQLPAPVFIKLCTPFNELNDFGFGEGND